MPFRPILLTGATGFVGAVVLDRLLRAGHEVVCLVRAGSDADADARLRAVLARAGAPAGARARAVAGDLTAPGLGLGARRAALAAEIGTVVHGAASVAFDLSLDDSRAINVAGTRRVLELAAEAPGLERVVHVSTAYVAGARRGTVAEDDPGHGPFRNPYERSKREAEDLVRASGMPATVLRPSIIAGERETGWTASFNVLYVPVRAFAAGALPVLPARRPSPVDVVSVDYVADAVAALALHPAAAGRTFHLVAGARDTTVREVVALASRHFGRRAPVVLPPRLYGAAVHPVALRRASGPALRQLRRSECYFPYFALRQRFDDAGARALLDPLGIAPAPLASYFDALMDFAQAAAWGRRPLSRPEAAALAATPPDRRRAAWDRARAAWPAPA
ncbi:MAG: SDR family oxidoreductase [Solirubrobacteraceae bacterium]